MDFKLIFSIILFLKLVNARIENIYCSHEDVVCQNEIIGSLLQCDPENVVCTTDDPVQLDPYSISFTFFNYTGLSTNTVATGLSTGVLTKMSVNYENNQTLTVLTVKRLEVRGTVVCKLHRPGMFDILVPVEANLVSDNLLITVIYNGIGDCIDLMNPELHASAGIPFLNPGQSVFEIAKYDPYVYEVLRDTMGKLDIWGREFLYGVQDLIYNVFAQNLRCNQ